jgi:hypothetical protein
MILLRKLQLDLYSPRIDYVQGSKIVTGECEEANYTKTFELKKEHVTP